MKRTLLVFSQRGTLKPTYLYNVTVEPADNVLGARDIIALAYGDMVDADELRVVREEVALARKWIEKPIAKAGKRDQKDPHARPIPHAKAQTVSTGAVNPFD